VPAGALFAGSSKEAVFSSSEDRIRAGQANVPAAGPLIVSEKAEWTGQPLAVRTINSLFTVLFPSNCRICNEPLLNVSRLPVCPECLEAIRPVEGKVCSVCGERVLSDYAFTEPDGLKRCPVCRRIQRPFERAVAYGSYDGGLRELIHMLKYSGVRPAARVLGRMLAEAIAQLEPNFSSSGVQMIPVPLYKGKRRQRGFNQAELIAGEALKFRPAQGLELASDILYRTRATDSQIGLTSHQRRENMRGAFAVTRAVAVTGKVLLLVDDVYTTGTTASECARVLRRAGAAEVWVATVARTLKWASKYAELQPAVNESALVKAG
jgi:ComF family protein